MRITKDRRTDLSDLQLREPEKFPLTTTTPLNLKNDLRNDKRPLRFTSPLYSPLTPGRLVTVHPENSNKTGGFFGLTRSQGQQMHQGIDIEASSEKDLQNGVLAAEDGVDATSGSLP